MDVRQRLSGERRCAFHTLPRSSLFHFNGEQVGAFAAWDNSTGGFDGLAIAVSSWLCVSTAHRGMMASRRMVGSNTWRSKLPAWIVTPEMSAFFNFAPVRSDPAMMDRVRSLSCRFAFVIVHGIVAAMKLDFCNWLAEKSAPIILAPSTLWRAIVLPLPIRRRGMHWQMLHCARARRRVWPR